MKSPEDWLRDNVISSSKLPIERQRFKFWDVVAFMKQYAKESKEEKL